MKIYLIENLINNKKYVGQTVKSIEDRFRGHVLSTNSNSNLHLHKAMRKYGIENFSIREIDEASSYEELLLREQYWIDLLDTFNTGYNQTLGGEGSYGRLVSEESKAKASISLKEYYSSPKNRKFTSERTKLGMKKWMDSLTPEELEEFKYKSGSSSRGKKFPGKGKGIKKPLGFGEQVSKRLKGVPKSKEHIEKMRINRKGKKTGLDNPMSDPENRKKISEKAKNRKRMYREDGSWYWGRKE